MSVPTPGGASDVSEGRQDLPADALATTRLAGRYPGRRHPRRGDLVATIVFTALLYFLVVVYEITGISRAQSPGYAVDGTLLANALAIGAPLLLGVFSTVFSTVFVLRRVPAFWLPLVAAALIVALYSVTSDMLDTAVLNATFG